MIVTKISRTYSRSINTRTYGAAESWVKVESTYEAAIESGDDPLKVSADLATQCQNEVAAQMAEIISKIKASVAGQTTAPAGSTTPPPASPVAPRPLS